MSAVGRSALRVGSPPGVRARCPCRCGRAPRRRPGAVLERDHDLALVRTRPLRRPTSPSMTTVMRSPSGGPMSSGLSLQMRGRTISAGGAVGPLLTISAPLGVIGLNTPGPEVAVAGDGDGFVVWRGTDGTNFRAQGRAISTTGARGPVLTLSNAGQDVSLPQGRGRRGGRRDRDLAALGRNQRADPGANDLRHQCARAGDEPLARRDGCQPSMSTSPPMPTATQSSSGSAWTRAEPKHGRSPPRAPSGPMMTLSGAGHDARTPRRRDRARRRCAGRVAGGL